MLLDEPFSALDTALRSAMHELLGEVRAALDPTIVMVTHDLDEAGLADRVAVLVEGRIQQVDPIDRLYSAPKTLAVARLVGGFNELPGTIAFGAHHSGLGTFALPGCVKTEGPAVLLIRKERLALAALDAMPTVTGRVVQIRQSGPHQDVEVELDDPLSKARLRVDVQVRLRTSLRPGDRTGVVVPSPEGLWAVGATGAGESSRACDWPPTRSRVPHGPSPGGWR